MTKKQFETIEVEDEEGFMQRTGDNRVNFVNVFNEISGWFDDGTNFRITVVNGLITAIEDSTAGGHS